MLCDEAMLLHVIWFCSLKSLWGCIAGARSWWEQSQELQGPCTTPVAKFGCGLANQSRERSPPWACGVAQKTLSECLSDQLPKVSEFSPNSSWWRVKEITAPGRAVILGFSKEKCQGLFLQQEDEGKLLSCWAFWLLASCVATGPRFAEFVLPPSPAPSFAPWL